MILKGKQFITYFNAYYYSKLQYHMQSEEGRVIFSFHHQKASSAVQRWVLLARRLGVQLV